MEYQRFRHLLNGGTRVFLLLSSWYLSCYLLMMDWRVLAYHPLENEWTGDSCYYLAPGTRVPGNVTMIAGSACWANSFFRPLDSLLYRAKAACGFRVFRSGYWMIWSSIFGLNLLLPSLSVAFVRGERLKQQRGKLLLLSLLAAGLYFGLFVLYHATRQEMVNVYVGKFLAVIVTTVALAVLYQLAHARGYTFVIPVASATLSGMIWFLVSLPCKWPYR